MNNYGQLIAPDTLQFERILPGPIERVWEYLTDPEKRRKWFAGGPMELSQNGPIEFHFKHDELSESDDPIPEKYANMKEGTKSDAKVLKLEPPNLLVIEWEGVVTFELSEQEEKVKLVLTHEKLAHGKDARVGTLAGWHTHLNILVDHLEGRSTKGFWSVHMPLEGEYAERL
jgi:uncharacterized protein YndB with AHSA1/START domain